MPLSISTIFHKMSESTEPVLRVDDEEAERLLDLPCSSQSANVRQPQHPLSEKDDCFSKSEMKKGNQKKKPRFEAVTIPLTEWNEMKEQNKRILAFLSQNIGESPHDQAGDEMLTQTPKRAKNVKQKCLMTRASRMNQWSQITMIKLI